MIKNYFKIALRNIFRNKLYSFLNIAGLGVGIACSILIIFYVQDELSFDRFHVQADKIYRLVPTFVTSERTLHMATNAHALGPMLQAEYPEVEKVVRMTGYGSRKVLRNQDKMFSEDKFLWIDETLLEVFSFKLVKGDPRQALVKPHSLVITEEMAEKYFGREDPIGKNLELNHETLYTVTGVMENIPKTSHIRPDFFASFSTLNLKPTGNSLRDLLNQLNYYTYLQLREGTDPKDLDQKFSGFIDQHIGPALKQLGGTAQLELQPLTSLYLHSDRENELERTSDITYVYLFSGIGLFILLLACLNFMNLSTARSTNRAKEVGLRKVVGAHKRQLIQQFLGESLILSVIALLFALILVLLSLPIFSNISGKELNTNFLSNPVFLLGMLGILLVVSLVGGSYPAFFLSAFQPVDVLQGKLKRGSKGSLMRIILVSFQFTVSIILIIGTLIVSRQLNYVRNKKLGYDKDHIVALQVRNPETRKKSEAIKTALLKNANILNVSASSTIPLGMTDFSAHHAVGKPDDEILMLSAQMVDENYIDTYKMRIVQGRNFSKEYPTDAALSIIVNESTIRKLGWTENPINREIERFTSPNLKSTKKYKIVGIVNDYHYQSLHEEIMPMVLYNTSLYGNELFNIISVRMRPENIRETIGFMKSKWAEFDIKYPFEFVFVDDQYDELYRTEERMGQLFRYFTALAILIGCLGLFGLTSFTAEQRTKEIGIRKVLGASVSGIIILLVKEFTKWVLLAVLFAWPIGFYIMHNWLQSFAYRISLSAVTFITAALLALGIAIITVSYQAVRSANANPVKALKYE